MDLVLRRLAGVPLRRDEKPIALDNLRRVVRGCATWSGSPACGASRAYLNPALPGFPTAEQLVANYPDCDLSVALQAVQRVADGEFKGLWFKNDVSKDEYAAHMFAYAVIWEIIDDPEVRKHVEEVVLAIGDHLVDNELWITDIDGKVTTFGHMNALALDDFSGFNAVLALSWLRLAATIGGQKYLDYYRKCMLQANGRRKCVHEEDPAPYTDYLTTMAKLGCKTNWNNHNMAQLAMYHLLRFEDDPALKAVYRAALRDQMWAPEDPYPMRDQQKTLYTFFYLVNKDPADPFPAQAASEAVCTMKIFPEFKGHYAVDNFTKYAQVCLDRSDEPITDTVIPVNERGMDNCVWLNPCRMEEMHEHRRVPEDFLSAWMAGTWLHHRGYVGALMRSGGHPDTAGERTPSARAVRGFYHRQLCTVLQCPAAQRFCLERRHCRPVGHGR